MSDLSAVAPDFVTMAHRIVWCTVATVDRTGAPRTRVLHPVWEWDGTSLTGWIATSPLSVKAKHLAETPAVSLTYWDATQDTCTADCAVSWEDEAGRRAGWDRFVNAPAPVGYNPSMIPGWDNADSPGFGMLRLTPTALYLMPGTMLMTGQGEILRWRA